MELTTVALKLSLVGSLLFLDRMHTFQFMISRPLVTAPVIGLLAGNLSMGLLLGAIIELLWIHRIPLGTDITPDDTTLAVLVASVGALDFQVERGSEFAPWMFGFLIFLPAAYANPRIELALRKFNNRLWHGAREAIQRGYLGRVAAFHWAGAVLAFISCFILLFAWLFVGLHVIRISFPLVPSSIKMALNITAWFTPAVGVACALNTAPNRWALVLFSLSFLMLLLLS
jgi:mannose/fructose/N-acetylgalactosamine-specific phosphotransferase system component IIC